MIPGFVGTLLTQTKDASLALGARTYLNHKLRKFGEMTEFSLDTKTKSLRIRLELLGEPEPIEITVQRYSIKGKGAAARLTVEEATASREWMNVALKEFVVGKAFELPAKAETVLKLLV